MWSAAIEEHRNRGLLHVPLFYCGAAIEECRNRRHRSHSSCTAPPQYKSASIEKERYIPFLLRRSFLFFCGAPLAAVEEEWLFPFLLLRSSTVASGVPHQSEFLVLLSHPLFCLSCPCEISSCKIVSDQKINSTFKVFFLMWPPLARRHLSEPPSLVYISTSLHILHITNHAGPSL